jgi:signal transduction histidine kinase
MVGAVVTALILATPYVTFGFESPSGHLVLNSLDGCVGLLVAYLVHGRFLRHQRLQDLLLSHGLALLVLAGLGLSYVTQLRSGISEGTLEVWLPLTVRVLGAMLIAAAALVGPRRTVEPQSRHLWAGLPTLAVVALLVAVYWLVAPALPVALDLGVVPSSAQHPILTGHPVLLAAQFVAGLCFGLAALLFTLQADGCDNELLRWLGPACALGAFARLNYCLYPSLYTDWLYTGDLLRTGFYLVLLVGAMREIRQYWSDQAHLAVLEDRRRLAGELHDGVIQELTYIRAEALLAGPGKKSQIVGACDRALGEARAAVHALGSQGDQPLSSVLERATAQLAEQYQVEVHFQMDGSVDAEPRQRHALVRIAREAVTNAVRHGGASRIRVALSCCSGGRTLSVQDDGAGFEVTAAGARPLSAAGGYGLISMRDRARSLPGALSIESAPGDGCVVRVTW